jgi:hypothetical protein
VRIKYILLMIGLVSGCASTYEQVHVTAPSDKLEQGKSILIATPANGQYETINYSESGMMTAAAVNSAFASYSDNISIAADCQDLACLQSKSPGVDYFVIPEILHWEDRNTEWSGKKDVIEIKLSVVDAASGTDLATSVISGKSKWATFGGDHPQDLLPEPLTAQIATHSATQRTKG